MIIQLGRQELPQAAALIRESFSTVAKEFGLTRQNCPTHTSFMKNAALKKHFDQGWLMYGLYEERRMVGFVALHTAEEGLFVLKHLAVLPAYRCRGYGKELLDFCKAQAQALGIWKIVLTVIEEHSKLKRWYLQNGFAHVGTQRFESLPFTVGYMEWTA